MFRSTAILVLLGLPFLANCNRQAGPADAPHKPTAAAPVPSPETAPESAEKQQLIADGAEVFSGIAVKYAGAEPYLFGGLGTPVALDLSLAPRAWEALSPEQRVALSYFLESKIADVRRNPARYSIAVPPDAPIYPQFASDYRKICDTCWTIWTGRYDPNSGAPPDTIVLAGDERWSWIASKDEAIRGSTYRKKILGSLP